MPVKIAIIIRALYEVFSVQVVYNGQKTEPLNVVAFQWSLTISSEDLDFADDLALLSHIVRDMKDNTQALKEQGAKVGVGLKINAAKTN